MHGIFVCISRHNVNDSTHSQWSLICVAVGLACHCLSNPESDRTPGCRPLQPDSDNLAISYDERFSEAHVAAAATIPTISRLGEVKAQNHLNIEIAKSSKKEADERREKNAEARVGSGVLNF